MKLALNGQWKEISGLIYTYPENVSDIPNWAKSIFDPRKVRGLVKGDYCYALWRNEYGYYYACIKTNTDSRSGCVMLTICVENKVPLDGSLMSEKMRSLLEFCLSKNEIADITYVDVSIRAKEIEDILTYRMNSPAPSSDSDKMAYRLYGNERDLKLILENPCQLAYSNFKFIVAVEESSFDGDAIFTQSLTQITDPIKKTYDIRSDSNDVVASKNSVMEGEMLSITYRKTGYADECVEVVAGRPSAYYTIDGNVINLKSGSAAGINFMKEVILHVVDEESNSPIKKWSCKIDGSLKNDTRIENADGSVSYRIAPYRSHMFVIYADGYEEKTLELAAGEHGLKTVRLHSSDDSVFVRLQLGKEEFSGSVRMKSNNKLYYPLKRLDEKNKVLQVKRGFFSRRNLVPILVLFLISLLLGGMIGKFVIKDKKPPMTNTPTVDSADYSALNIQLESIKGELENVKLSNDFYKKAMPMYGKTLTLIKEKTSKNPDAVVDALSKIEYKALLEGNETNLDLIVFNQIIEELNVIKEKSNKGNSEASKEENHLQGNIWDLTYLSTPKYKALANAIRNGDVNTMKNYVSLGDTNHTWGTILDKLNDLDTQDKKMAFAIYMKGKIKDNKINLDDLKKFFEN